MKITTGRTSGRAFGRLAAFVVSALAAGGAFAATHAYSGYVPVGEANKTTVFTGVSLSEIGTTYQLSGCLGGGWVAYKGPAGAVVTSTDNGVLTAQFQKIDGDGDQYVKCVIVKFQEDGNGNIAAYTDSAKYTSTLSDLGTDLSGASGGTAAGSVGANGYGVYGLRLAPVAPTAEWYGDFFPGARGSASKGNNTKNGLTISKNNNNNTATTEYIMISDNDSDSGWPMIVSGLSTKNVSVVVGYKVGSDVDGTILSLGTSSSKFSLNAVSGALYTGYTTTYNRTSVGKNQPTDGEIHYAVYTYSSTDGVVVYYDGMKYKTDSGLKEGGTTLTELCLGAVSGPAQQVKGAQYYYVAVYNSTLSDTEAATAYDRAYESINGVTVATSAVDGSNNLTITATDDTFYTVGSATTYNSITFDVAAGKTLKLFGATLTAGNGITIRGGAVEATMANALAGALSGSGTLVYDGVKPTGLTFPDGWTGVLCIKNMTGSNQNGIWFGTYGNSGSTVRLDNVQMYVSLSGNTSGTFYGTLDIGAGGLEINNGNSGTKAIVGALTGSGELKTSTGAQNGNALVIKDASGFTGSVDVSNTYRHNIVFGDDGSVYAYNQAGVGGISIASGKTVTVPAGKTWNTANGITVAGALIVNGTVTGGPITVSDSGSVTVNAGATVPDFGTQRDFTGWTVDSSVTITITQTSEEFGKGTTTVTGVSNISSITVNKPDGTTAVISPDGSTATLSETVQVSGKACWCDYEMEYESGNANKTGFENTGTDTTSLNSDSGIIGDNAFYNGMLYTYAHPWRNITYPTDGNWTAVVRCTVPAYENAAIITFGTCNGGLIGLVAGADPETQMKLVKTTGNSAFTVLSTMTVQNATTAQHVYIFSVENNQTIKVYCDGEQVLNETYSSFTLGGGIQVGSVHGGVNSTGIIRFAKGESPANTLSETVQKDARIDCVRLFKYQLSAAQIAQLSVEFPAVKLFEATISGGTENEWSTLNWSGDISTLNAYSKIILTVADDATLALPSSITAEDFFINIAAGKTLTLDQGSGVTLNLANPLEVNGGAIAFSGSDIKLGSAVNIGGTGTVKLANGTTVDEALSGTAKVEIASGDTVAVMSGGSVANPLTGAGTLSYQYTTVPASALSFSGWTGAVILPGCTPEGQNFNNYGVSGSKVVLAGAWTGWIQAGVSFSPELVLNANLTITAMSSYDYTFAKVSGSGNLSFATTEHQPSSITIAEVASDFTGSIANSTTPTLTITTLARPSGQVTTAGTKLLSTSANVAASALTVGGAATDIIPVFDTDGLYVKAASVTKDSTTTNYNTVSDAMAAAGSGEATITLLMPTDSAIALAPGQTLVTGGFATGAVTSGANGYEVRQTGGTYELVDNRTSTWTGGANDGSWTNGGNWSTGFKPTQYTDVTFPAGDGEEPASYSVTLTASNGSEACKSITLGGNLTLQYSGGSWVEFYLFGGVSGTGTLKLSHVCLNNRTNSGIEISCPVEIAAVQGDSAFLGTGSWTISGPLAVNGYLKAQNTALTVSGDATFASSGVTVETQAAITITGTTTLNGGFSRDTSYGDAQLTFGDVTVAASTAITGAKPTTFSGTVTLAAGATLTVPTASTTVSGATFTTSAAGSYVQTTTSGQNTVYSVKAFSGVMILTY